MGSPPVGADSDPWPYQGRWSAAAFGLVALAYLVWIWSLPSDTFWAGDMGVKLIQVESLLRSGFTRLSLDYPGRAIDPEGTYFPLARLFATRVNGSWFAVFPPLFPALSAPLYLLLGYRGLYVLPVLSSALVLGLSLALCRRAEIGAHAVYLPVLLGLGSPLFLYSVVFWEHSLGACLCLAGSILALWPRGPARSGLSRLAAGALLGLAAAVRPECYWFAAACVVACMRAQAHDRWRCTLQVGVGVAAVSSVSWAFNTAVFGHALGLHYVLNVRETFGDAPRLSGMLAQAGQNALRMLLNPSTEEVVNLWVLIPLGLFVLACWSRARGFIAAAALLAMAPLVVLMLDPHLKEGLFAVSPVCVFWLAAWPFDDKRRGADFHSAAAVVVSIFIVGVIVTSPRAGGWQFGPRLLLPAYPLLILLSIQGAIALQRRFAQKMVMAVFLGCACVGVVTAFQALHIANRHKANWALLKQAFRQIKSDVIVTDRPYLPQSLASLYYEKKFFLLPTDDATDLLNRLAHAGVSRFLFVSNSPHVRYDPNAAKGFRELEECPRRTFMETVTFREYLLRQ